jgi:hypothetical protein
MNLWAGVCKSFSAPKYENGAPGRREDQGVSRLIAGRKKGKQLLEKLQSVTGLVDFPHAAPSALFFHAEHHDDSNCNHHHQSLQGVRPHYCSQTTLKMAYLL